MRPTWVIVLGAWTAVSASAETPASQSTQIETRNLFHVPRVPGDLKVVDVGRSLRQRFARTAMSFLENTGFPHPSGDYSVLEKNFHDFVSTLPNLLSPSKGLKKVRRTSSASSRLTSNDMEYLGPFSIGTPAKQFQLDFDTGSNDIWVPGCAESKCYDSNKSTSVKVPMQQDTVTFTYGDGSVAYGKKFTDIISFGNLHGIQDFAVVNEQQGGLEDSSGLVGLAWPEIAKMKVPSFVQSLHQQKQIPKALFGFDLRPKKAQLTIGDSDKSRYDASGIQWIPLSTQGYWQIDNVTFIVNGHKVGPYNAILDTGTTGIVFPMSEIDNLYKKVKDVQWVSGYAVYDCGDHPMNLTVDVQGDKIPIPSDDYTISINAGYCQNLVYGSQNGFNFVILGDAFLRERYSIYDYTNKRVGLAKYI